MPPREASGRPTTSIALFAMQSISQTLSAISKKIRSKRAWSEMHKTGHFLLEGGPSVPGSAGVLARSEHKRAESESDLPAPLHSPLRRMRARTSALPVVLCKIKPGDRVVQSG